MKKAHPYDYRLIKSSQLKVDRTYQRRLDENRVAKIVREFEPDLFNEPKVSQRDDGNYYIFNGQHSVGAHKRVYGPDAPIICKVYRGLTWEEEKDLFVKQNGISKDPTTNEKLRAEYEGNNKDVVDMVEAARDANVVVDFGNHLASYKCVATAALFNTYKKVGRMALTNILSVIGKTWGGESLSFSAGFIGGLAIFFTEHNGMFTIAKLINALSKYSPEYYVREAKELVGRSVPYRYYMVFLRVYNKGKSANKLSA